MRKQYKPQALFLLILFFATTALIAENSSLGIALFKTTNFKKEIQVPASLEAVQKVSPSTVTDTQENKILLEENLKTSDNLISLKASTTPLISTNSLHPNMFKKGFFYGFMLMATFLCLICFYLFKEKLFLHFSFLLLGFQTLLFNSDGLTGLFVDINAESSALIASALLAIVSVVAGVFTYNYFQLNQSKTLLRKNAVFILVASLSSIVLISLVQIPSASVAINIISSTLLLSYLIIGMQHINKKNYSKYFVIAFAIPLFFIIDYFIFLPLNMEILATNSLQIKLSIVVEMLVLSYAIIYRMNSIKEESEIRKIEMQMFLKNQEAMSRQNIEFLMQDVYLENLIMNHDLDGMQIKLLQYISEGKTNDKIARKLKTTESGVLELITELYYRLELEGTIQEDQTLMDSQPDYIYN